MTMATLNA